ncbi:MULTISPECIES: DUF4783 domain-containing protein [unclassified Carboxylicivirga]|uniref:DUF4783 domain-containing protein n=1 Tax=Carboxylicivirga TaxID=1628153 RepID=UPI003D341567
MTNSKYIFTILSVLVFSSMVVSAQQTAALPSGTIMAMKKSDAETIAASFNDRIEIILPNKTAIYSQKQAEMVLKNFFDNHTITEFQLVHQGKKDNASYAIANYFAADGRYRFTFLTKQKQGKIYIHQIRIEKQ